MVSHDINYFLYLLNEDDFLGRARDGSELEEAGDERHMQVLRLLQVVLDTELKLGIVGRQRLDFVEWNEHSLEEKRMLLLQWCGQAGCNGGEYLEKLRQPVMRLNIVLVDDFEEHVHDLLLDVLSQSHEFAVNPMENRLEVVSLTRVLAVEELEEAADKVVRDVLHDHILAQVHGKDEFEEQFVD